MEMLLLLEADNSLQQHKNETEGSEEQSAHTETRLLMTEGAASVSHVCLLSVCSL